jgi:hypothetical protein
VSAPENVELVIAHIRTSQFAWTRVVS